MLKQTFQAASIPYDKDEDGWTGEYNSVSPYIETLDQLVGLTEVYDASANTSYVWLIYSSTRANSTDPAVGKYFAIKWTGDTVLPSIPEVVPNWQASTAYVVGQYVQNHGHLYACIADGTSGPTMPTWQDAQVQERAVQGGTYYVTLEGVTPDGIGSPVEQGQGAVVLGGTSYIVTEYARVYDQYGVQVWPPSGDDNTVRHYISNGGVLWQDTGLLNASLNSAPVSKGHLPYGTTINSWTDQAVSNLITSRSGKMYLNLTGTPSSGLAPWKGDNHVPDPNDPTNWLVDSSALPYYADLDDLVAPSSFESMSGDWVTPAYDDVKGLVLDALGTSTLKVWDRNGALVGGKYPISSSIVMPSVVVALALGDFNRLYVLCQNRVLILLDYIRKVVLGAVKVPSTANSSTFALGTVVLGWDSKYKRVLIAEKVANNIDGSCAVKVCGYYPVPVPVRLAKPIPLAPVRSGQKVKFLFQQVGDMNEGVLGSVLDVTVSGGSTLLTQVPLSDNRGQTKVEVLCGDPGSVTMSGSIDL